MASLVGRVGVCADCEEAADHFGHLGESVMTIPPFTVTLVGEST
jgi:hypothetical protein